MKNKILGAVDYKDELANIIEIKGFGEEIENLLLSMLYKAEDGFVNYSIVKREVPTQAELAQEIVENVKKYCKEIIIAEPNSDLAKELKEKRCKIIPEENEYEKGQKVISFPNEKTLLYGITKAGIINKIKGDMTLEEKAILTAINIGKCISTSEVIRDFNGWSWSIVEKEIENTQCNIIYNFLVFLLGYSFVESITDIRSLKNNIPESLYEEIKKVSIEFYRTYDVEENEKLLNELSIYKAKLQKMRNQVLYQEEITRKKKEDLSEIKHIDEILNNPQELKNEYIELNSKLTNENKIFSVSNYEEIVEEKRKSLISELAEFNRMQNPTEFTKIKEELLVKIKLIEEKTDISKLEKEFLKCFETKIDMSNDRKTILNLIYETRYLNFLPNCKMRLNDIEEKLIPKAIELGVINPISNNNELDYRILKGIFDSQVVSLEGLYIQLSTAKEGICVELYDGEVHDRTYIATTPEGSDIEIRRTKKTKIFARI